MYFNVAHECSIKSKLSL